jgi:hypothetical protein
MGFNSAFKGLTRFLPPYLSRGQDKIICVMTAYREPTAERQNEWSYISAPPHAFTV